MREAIAIKDTIKDMKFDLVCTIQEDLQNKP